MSKGRTSEAKDPYARLRTRAHWKPADAARMLSDWRRSGVTMAAFAARHGLSVKRLRWWHERREESSQPSGARLVPAVVRPAPLVSVGSVTTLAAVSVVAEGVRVDVLEPARADPRWVAALVSSLRGGHA